MAIAKKRPPTVTVQEMQRIVQQIFDDINDVINSVNQSVSESRSTASGKDGDIRVVKDLKTQDYRIEAYTADGWAKTDLEIVKE